MIEKYLGLIIKHFNLTKESVDSLKDKFDIQWQTKSRLAFTKKRSTNFSILTNELKRGTHLAIVEALKKYADNDSLDKYMQEEGYQYEESKEGTYDDPDEGFRDISIELPNGTIKKLIGRELTWEDEPVELI